MSEATHTPTPWFVKERLGILEIRESVSPDQDVIAVLHGIRPGIAKDIRANAAFICKAVSNHESLLEALRELLVGARKAMSGSYYEQEPSVIKARAAIAKAEAA